MNSIKNNRKGSIRLSAGRLIISFASALLILVADYLLSNVSFPLFDESESLNWFGFLEKERNLETPDEVFYVNTAIDKQLVPVKDEFNDTIGFTAITDRSALLKFLEIAQETDYRFIMLDVRFEKDLQTEYDSALFDKILEMPRLVFSNHRQAKDYSIADSSLLSSAAMADYRANMFSGFSRYEFLQDGHESVALRLYRELDGKDIEPAGPIYLSDGTLSYNMQFIPLPVIAAHPEIGHEENNSLIEYDEIRYPYLSSRVLSYYSPEELHDYLADKIIIIGDFDNDLHQSYVGEIPGPLIHYYAYRLLLKGGHKVNLICQLVLLLVYTLIAYNLLGDEDVTEKICSILGIKSPAGVFILSFFSWGAILTVTKVILYLTLRISLMVSIPTIVFSIIVLPGAYRKIKKERQLAESR